MTNTKNTREILTLSAVQSWTEETSITIEESPDGGHVVAAYFSREAAEYLIRRWRLIATPIRQTGDAYCVFF